MNEKGLGKRVQLARQRVGMTQQELCQRAGLSYSTLAKIERGAIKSPSIFTISNIAAVLTIPLDSLVGTPSLSPVTKKHSKSGVSFVYFDINGCLVRFFHRAFTRLAEQTSASADTIETTFWHYNDAVCRGEMSMEEFNKVLAKQLAVSSLDWQEYYMGAVDPIEEMNEVVAWASEQYQVGLLSNIMPGFIELMRHKRLIPNVHYSSIVDSSVVGVIKPEPRIYEIATEQAHCHPSEILLVDDSRPNLIAAERLSWHVLWFDDYRPGESAASVRTALEPAAE